MPGIDKTGPTGEGPKTGNALGPCGSGLYRRGGFGRRCGFGRCFAMNLSQNKEDRAITLRNYQKTLKKELDNIEKELKN